MSVLSLNLAFCPRQNQREHGFVVIAIPIKPALRSLFETGAFSSISTLSFSLFLTA